MSDTQNRKADHIRICLEEDVESNVTTGLEKYRFLHCALPELDLLSIDISTQFLGKPLGVPLLISSMTGGTDQAQIINHRLAKIAQSYKMAMGIGSQRVAIEHPHLMKTFDVRQIAPDILLLANIGAVQLNYKYSIEHCQRIVDQIQADGLILHLNPLQESIQTNGDTNFQGLLDKISKICYGLKVPVIIKEVGNGISAKLAQQLLDCGVSAIDVAGAGGTSWAMVESQRAETAQRRRIGQTFRNWGIPTAECIINIRQEISSSKLPLIASGGLDNGIDIGKAIALGADLAGIARPFLKAAVESEESLANLAEILISELKIVLFCTGSANLTQLKRPNIIEKK